MNSNEININTNAYVLYMEHTYTFLNDDPLHKSFDICVGDISNVQIQLCMFDISTECSITVYDEISQTQQSIPMPFLKYMLELSNNQFVFPQFTYSCINNSSEDNDAQFQTECITQLTSKLGLSQSGATVSPNTLELRNAFQGMVVRQSTVFVFYNYQIISQHFAPTPASAIAGLPAELPVSPPSTTKFVWGIVDEVVFKKYILETPVDPAISKLFLDMDILWNIERDGGYIDLPFALHMVVETPDGKFENERQTTIVASQSSTVFDKPSVSKSIGKNTDAYVYGDIYGDMFLFSTTAIQPNMPRIRYAVYISGAKYVLDDNLHLAFKQYMQQETQNLPQTGGNDDVINKDAYPAVENAMEDSEDTSDIEEDELEEEQTVNNMSVSAIYFVETQKLSSQQLWGVRKETRFAAL